MRPRPIIAALACLLTLVSCTPEAGDDVPNEITGVVTKVDSGGLTDVRGFTVRAEGGNELYDITVDEATEFAFPPAHLNEHRVSGEPIAVEVDNRSGTLYATSIDDA